MVTAHADSMDGHNATPRGETEPKNDGDRAGIPSKT